VKVNNPGKPVDQLRSIAAPRELIEWVRKLPTDTALRTAWVDATRADWLPYIAITRGITTEVILRATCECALEVAGNLPGPEAPRVLAYLRDMTRERLATVERDLADLRGQLIAWNTHTQPTPKPPWMFWAELVFELARATGRGNPIVGIALAMRMLTTADTSSKARAQHGELVAKLREKLTLST
jgi:hypothetical protein